MGKNTAADFSCAELGDNPTTPDLQPQSTEKALGDVASSQKPNLADFADAEKSYLRSLWFSGMGSRHAKIEGPCPDTTKWLFEHHTYQKWQMPIQTWTAHNLLWLKGNPGTGKSVLLKEACRQTSIVEAPNQHPVAAFFFNAKGHKLEQNPIGMLRSLLYQLLTQNRRYLRKLSHAAAEIAVLSIGSPDPEYAWNLDNLQDTLKTLLSDVSSGTATIFVDALDECSAEDIRRQTAFWLDLPETTRARVCISCRHFPNISTGQSPIIAVERYNTKDIGLYVDRRLQRCVHHVPEEFQTLANEVSRRAQGAFLWAVLVLDDLIEAFDEGQNIAYLRKRLDDVPSGLALLFDHILDKIPEQQQWLSFATMSWAALSRKPLRVEEWYHVMAIIQEPPIASIGRWRGSETSIDSDLQLERRLRVMSRGLVEISGSSKDEKSEDGSSHASAGSLNLEVGSSRFVQVIHSSISQHLQSGAQATGFQDSLVRGHLRILNDCLRYIMLTDLDEFVKARQQHLCALPIETGSEKSEASVEGELATDSARTGRTQSDGPRPLHPSHGPPGSTSGKPISGTGRHAHSSQVAHARFDPARATSKLSRTEVLLVANRSDLQNNVLAWLEDAPGVFGQLAPPSTQPDFGPAPASVHSLELVRTRVLKEHMALLPYIMTYFWEHARQLQSADFVPITLIDSFCKPEMWRRWQALDDMAPHFPEYRDSVIQASYFRHQGLSTWETSLTTSHKIIQARREIIQGQISIIESALRRRRSVASFSSASSHQ